MAIADCSSILNVDNDSAQSSTAADQSLIGQKGSTGTLARDMRNLTMRFDMECLPCARAPSGFGHSDIFALAEHSRDLS